MSWVTPTNWVKARRDSTIPAIFEALRERVKADVEEFNSSEGADHRCVFGEIDSAFSVLLAGSGSVRFQENPDRITVSSESERSEPAVTVFSVKPRWDDEADTCHLMLGGSPLELWQISKKALSPLFFGLDADAVEA